MKNGRTTRRAFGAAALGAAMLVGMGVQAEAAEKLRFGTVLSAQDPMGQGLERFAKQVGERTKGAVIVEIFHNSQLGDTRDMIDQARAGANVGTVTDVARLSSFVPELAVLSAPFVFDNFEDADKFANSEPYLKWGDQLKAKAGLVMLASNWYQGARHALTQKPVSKPSDLAGVKMRTIGAPVWIETIRAMGAVPTPMPWAEVYSACSWDPSTRPRHSRPPSGGPSSTRSSST
jgi:TRAP-type transport system periplasmic protein